ncbi:ankyrin [Apiospora arundinis]
MPPQVTTIPTCNTCRTSDEECTWKRQDDQCDRCIDHGLQCRRPRPARASSIEVKGEATRASTSETEQAAPAVFRSKNTLQCNTCRRHHQTCRPLGRVWPQKCERCIEKGWDCTPPRTKQEYEQDKGTEGRMRKPYARQGTARKSSAQQQQQQQQTPQDHHTNGMLMLVESDIMNDAEEVEDQYESSSERDPESSILVGGGDHHSAPLAKRQRTDSHINGGGDEGRAAGARVAASAAAATPSTATARGSSSAENDLQKTIHTMEEEFQEVLRMEQERHDAEIRNLKARYEQELVKQRERYEGRIDDLIKIMKSMGRVD